MKMVVKHFSELKIEEIFEIYKLRVAIFVVEQNCAYQEVDDLDKKSYHVWLEDENKIVAYARVIPSESISKSVSIGRVIAVKRNRGFGSKIVEEAIEVAKEKFDASFIIVEAQVYAKSLYEKLGFK